MGPEIAAGATAAGAGAGGISKGVALGLLLGGTAAQMVAAKQQQKQQKSLLNRAFERNEDETRGGAEQILTEAADLRPGAQAQAINAAGQAAAQRTMGDIRGAGADVIDSAGGRTPDAYRRAMDVTRASEGERMSRIAEEIGRARAPGQVQFDESLSRAALAERLASAARSNENRARAAQIDAQEVDAPWYGDAGKIAALVGGMGLGGAGAAGSSGAATGATNAALAESAIGSAGYGASSATPAAGMGMNSLIAQSLAQYGQGRQRRPATWYGGRR